MRGRKLSFSVVLTGEERAELERWQRTTTMPAGKVQRARAILLLADGTPLKEVMVLCGMTAKTVRKWGKRFVAERFAGLADRPGRGRKPAFPPGGRPSHREAGV